MDIALLDTLYDATGPEQVDRLNAGFPVSVFRILAQTVGLPLDGLAQALGLSPRTLRNRTRRLSADEAERSFRVYRVFRRASEVLGTDEAAAAWIKTPQRALGERAPLQLLVRDVGTEDVLNVLSAVEHGVYL